MFRINFSTIVKIIFAMLFIAGGVYCYNFYQADDTIEDSGFKNITDLEAAYNADEEIAKAKEKLKGKDLIPATVYTHYLDNRKVMTLTFDGLPRKGMADRLLDVLKEHDVNATFFAEGGNAAMNPEILQAIEDKGQSVGNYTYIGLSKLETHPQDRIIEQLCRAQKVLDTSTNKQIPYFKAPNSRYAIPLLRIAAACGIQSAVRTDTFVNLEALTSAAAAEQYVQTLKPGSILSIVINRPMEVIEQKESKIDDKPAFDKQPNLVLTDKPKVKRQDVAEATDLLLAALKKAGYKVVPLKQMRNVRLAEPAQTAPEAVAQVVGYLFDRLIFSGTAYASERGTDERVAMAQKIAAQKAKATSASDVEKKAAEQPALLAKKAEAQDTAPAKTDAEAVAAPKTAAELYPDVQEMKMVLTTEPALAFSFVGFSKPAEVEAILERMEQLHMHGTFFADHRDLANNDALMRKILAQGHEIGIAIYNRKTQSYASVEKDIATTKEMLKNKFGVDTIMVKQPWGALAPEVAAAVQKHGYLLVGHNVNLVQSRHKSYTSANDVVPELFGRFMYSLGRGWIINLRMDFYDAPGLAADVMQLVKEKKIDNIAYWSFYDDPRINPENDSAYEIKSIGDLYYNTRYRYELPAKHVPYELRYENNSVAEMKFLDYVQQRYIGNDTVNRDSNTLGFTQQELRYLDVDGVVRTKDPVVFFSFDDWGTDASINHLLYVLRKHNVKGTFFVLTNNVKNNPNLLRAIAEEGHDIASHTNTHRPLAVMGRFESMSHGLKREERFEDLKHSYQELERITGDVHQNGHYPLTKMFRPPTLTVSKMGMEELQKNGFEYIVSGSTSTHDYEAPDLYTMIDHVREGLYQDGKVKCGALFVMHMSDQSKYTARALDIILTENELKNDADPTKFYVARLSDYLRGDYDQSAKYLK